MTPASRLDHACYCRAWGGLRNACAVLAGRPPLWHPLLVAMGPAANRPGIAPRKGPFLGRYGAAARELSLWWHRGPSLCPHQVPWRLRLYGVGRQTWTPLAWLSKVEHLAACLVCGGAHRLVLAALRWGDGHLAARHRPRSCPHEDRAAAWAAPQGRSVRESLV